MLGGESPHVDEGIVQRESMRRILWEEGTKESRYTSRKQRGEKRRTQNCANTRKRTYGRNAAGVNHAENPAIENFNVWGFEVWTDFKNSERKNL